jgi:hypothetical protein
MTERPAKSRGAFEVILFEETRFVGSLMFTSSEVTIGSDPGVMVRLEDVDVAPCHAVLHFDGDSCRIKDCGTGLATEVNGVVVATQAIQGMDEISIGRYRLRITVHKADLTPAPVSVHRIPKPAGAATPKLPPLPVLPPSPPVPASASPSPRPAPPVVPVRGIEHTGQIWPPPTPPPPIARSLPATTTRLVSGAVPLVHPARPTSPAPGTRPSAPAIATATAPDHAARAKVEAVPANKLLVVAACKPLPNPPPSARARPDDDEDDDDTAFEPTFSLLAGLCEVGLTSASTEHTVEIIRFRHGCVTKLRHLRGGERLRLPGLGEAVGRSPRRGSFAFFRDALPESAAISKAGQPIDDALWRRRADKRGHVPLDPCTQVVFPLPSGEDVLVHLVPAAAPLPRVRLRLKPSTAMLWIGCLSLLVHVVVFAVIGLTSLVRREYIVDSKEGRFARIALKEIELEPPAAPPAREKKKAKPEPSELAPSETAPRVAVPRIPRARSTPSTQASATAQKLLSALGSMSAAPKTSVATAMSNLDAVAPVRGGGFKVSGAIGKLPGDSLRLAAAGSGIGRFDTKSANDVGKNLGRVLGRGPTGQVRAQVTAKPNTLKVEGQLDRGEIQRVINSHIYELQGCYERQLIVSPNLSGKVTFEWVISTGGGVTSVKIKASTLSSNEATSCMQAAIRRWQFPSPKGGSVTVIYPIALASSGT